MTDTDDSMPGALERVPSGLAGLDTILHGGFLRGGVYMVLARPGAGKTILGNQICFGHVASGGRAVVLTLLTESHSRLLAQLRPMRFFDPACIGSTLSYVAGFNALEKDGLKGLLALLRKVVRDHKATILVIDGLVTAGAMAASEVETKKFIHELQVFVELFGCTTLLLTGDAGLGEQYALRTMVDGLLELRLDAVGVEAIRTIEVTKFRGSNVLLGRHRFEISGAGITVYPRTESVLTRAPERPDPTLAPPAQLGIGSLDAMLGGGLRRGSITMALGAPGCGKTLLGLAFLAAGARAGEPGLYFGFFESPDDLRRKGDAIGLGLTGHVKSGLVEMTWHSPIDGIADALAEKLLAAVRQRKVRRLVIDGLAGLKDTLVHAERAKRFFGALCNELRSLGVVTIVSDETRTLGELETPEPGLTAILDNVISMQHVKVGARLHKLVSVTKIREAAGDPSVREFKIGARGFVVSPGSESAEATLASKKPRRRRER